MRPVHTKNEDLVEWLVPEPASDWKTIATFALSFDGYEYLPNGACGALSEKVRQDFLKTGQLPDGLNLSDLRACLFFEQRRANHHGHEPDAEAMSVIHALLAAISRRTREFSI
jgi:hypothetical protein